MASKDCLPNRLQKKLVGFFTNEFFILIIINYQSGFCSHFCPYFSCFSITSLGIGKRYILSSHWRCTVSRV